MYNWVSPGGIGKVDNCLIFIWGFITDFLYLKFLLVCTGLAGMHTGHSVCNSVFLLRTCRGTQMHRCVYVWGGRNGEREAGRKGGE